MTNLTKLFNYEGNEVTFRNHEGVVYVNATQMAKSFGNEKRPQFFLGNQNTSGFLEELSKARNLASTDLVKVKKGGNDQGTWMHEDVAIEFSRWLSPSFSIWCNDRIKELMTVGMTATPETLENMLTNPDLLIGLANQLKTERAEKERLLEENELAMRTIQIQAPKVEYVNKVLISESCHTTTTIAKELELSGQKLNKILASKKVQYWQDKHWVPYSKYQAMGYAKTRTHNYQDSEGRPKTSVTTVWTEKGREFIHNLITPLSPRPMSFN